MYSINTKKLQNWEINEYIYKNWEWIEKKKIVDRHVGMIF